MSMAAAIALGAMSMSDIAVLAHLAPVLGDAPSGPTIRRALDLAGTAARLDRIARARARARASFTRFQNQRSFPASGPRYKRIMRACEGMDGRFNHEGSRAR